MSESVRDHLLHNCDTFVFDCDGVLWHGDELIDGAKVCCREFFWRPVNSTLMQDVIAQLRANGKRVLFVTNSNARKVTFHKVADSEPLIDIYLETENS